MNSKEKKERSETDICNLFITPAVITDYAYAR